MTKKKLEVPAVDVYIPEGFGRHARSLGKDADAARYLLHLIGMRRLMRHKGAVDYTPLKRRYLQQVITSDETYERLLGRKPGKEGLLFRLGLVESDGKWQEGVKAIGFRVGPALLGQRYRKARIKDATLARRIAAWRDRRDRELPLPVHRHLLVWFDRCEFDHESACRLVDPGEEYAHEIRLGLDLLRDKHHPACGWFNTCDYGRVHTNVTSLGSRFRQFLSFRGEKLVNVDIANSQPMFLGVLLSSLAQNDGRKLDDFSEIALGKKVSKNLNALMENLSRTLVSHGAAHEIASARSGQYIQSAAYHTSNGHATSQQAQRAHPYDPKSGHLKPDLAHYIELTLAGQFYQYISRQTGIPVPEIKEKLFAQAMFCRQLHEGKLAKVMAQQFPTVMGQIRGLKRPQYQFLAHQLQRFESYTMIDGVCRDLMENHPETPILTIHDSILTVPSQVPTVMAALQRGFARINCQPTFKTTAY